MRVVYTCEKGHEQTITFDPSFSLQEVTFIAELTQWSQNESPSAPGCGICHCHGEFSKVNLVVHVDEDAVDTADTDRPTTVGEERTEPIEVTRDEYGNIRGTQRLPIIDEDGDG